MPSRTTTAPTSGFGSTAPRPRSANSRARRIQISSAADMRAFYDGSELASRRAPGGGADDFCSAALEIDWRQGTRKPRRQLTYGRRLAISLDPLQGRRGVHTNIRVHI